MIPFSVETPFCVGPRKVGQSAACIVEAKTSESRIGRARTAGTPRANGFLPRVHEILAPAKFDPGATKAFARLETPVIAGCEEGAPKSYPKHRAVGHFTPGTASNTDYCPNAPNARGIVAVCRTAQKSQAFRISDRCTNNSDRPYTASIRHEFPAAQAHPSVQPELVKSRHLNRSLRTRRESPLSRRPIAEGNHFRTGRVRSGPSQRLEDRHGKRRINGDEARHAHAQIKKSRVSTVRGFHSRKWLRESFSCKTPVATDAQGLLLGITNDQPWRLVSEAR